MKLEIRRARIDMSSTRGGSFWTQALYYFLLSNDIVLLPNAAASFQALPADWHPHWTWATHDHANSPQPLDSDQQSYWGMWFLTFCVATEGPDDAACKFKRVRSPQDEPWRMGSKRRKNGVHRCPFLLSLDWSQLRFLLAEESNIIKHIWWVVFPSSCISWTLTLALIHSAALYCI